MKILLVNNNTYYRKRLYNLLKEHDVTTIKPNQIKSFDFRPYDVIILSGGGLVAQGRRRSLVRFSYLYQDQIDFIRMINKPVIGICLGCQIIGFAYGAKLKRYFKLRRKGFFPIIAIHQNRVMGGKRDAIVFQSNHWVITELPDDLVCIAASNAGAEIIKHRSKPIWGIQFHPERDKLEGDGRKIFHRILKVIKENSNQKE